VDRWARVVLMRTGNYGQLIQQIVLAGRLHRQQLDYDDLPKSPDQCTDHMEGPNSRGRCSRCGTPLDPED
jgi:hypothetical protein